MRARDYVPPREPTASDRPRSRYELGRSAQETQAGNPADRRSSRLPAARNRQVMEPRKVRSKSTLPELKVDLTSGCGLAALSVRSDLEKERLAHHHADVVDVERLRHEECRLRTPAGQQPLGIGRDEHHGHAMPPQD